MFHGNSNLSAFQLARGYAPSILGIPSSVVTIDILNAHVAVVATRALHRVMKSRDNNVQAKEAFKKGDQVWVFFKTSKQNERVRWISAQVVEALKHGLKCRRSNKGQAMTVAYEHVRLAPTGALANELYENSLEDELYSQNGPVHDEADVGSDELVEQEGVKEVEQAHDREEIDEDEGVISTEEPTPVIDETPPERLPSNRNDLMSEIFSDDYDTTPQQDSRSFYTKAAEGEQEKDIGDIYTAGPKKGEELTSKEQDVLASIYEVIGSDQVTRKRMECAPQWILDKAVRSELEVNWKDAYVPIIESDVPRKANVITSHFVFKIKKEEGGKMRLKARLCPHGNRDKMKNDIRKDSATAQFDVIRLFCSMAAVLQFRLGCLDIKGAYLQSGPIQREIFVRPPKECGSIRGMLWRLVKMPYGISEAGRQWAKVFEGWILQEAAFERVFGVSQLFVKRDTSGNITMILAKVTDDLLIAGEPAEIRRFIEHIGERFPISKAIIDSGIKFNGCDITQGLDGTISLSMENYMSEMTPIDISPERKKHRMALATDTEKESFRSLAGEFVWIGSSAVPHASYIGSWMQQKVPRLNIDDVIQANGMLKEMKEMKASITFKTPSDDVEKVVVTSFSDAAFNVTKSSQYGQTGIICGIRYVSRTSEQDVYHLIDWASLKQRRVCYSSYGAEILACTEADDRGYNLKLGLSSLFPDRRFTHELNVDSKGLFDTVTTLHEGRDYRLRQTVQRIRDSFEAQEVNVIRWIQGPVNIADALTKRSTHSQKLLSRIAHDGILQLPPHRTYSVDSDVWK